MLKKRMRKIMTMTVILMQRYTGAASSAPREIPLHTHEKIPRRLFD